jgi:hypothetical protein
MAIVVTESNSKDSEDPITGEDKLHQMLTGIFLSP